MMWQRLIEAVSGLWAACGRSSWRVRYRLSIEIDTPQGPRTGASVLENALHGPNKIPFPGDTEGIEVFGEAPMIDLGEGRHLFVAIRDRVWKRDLASIVPRILAYQDLQPCLRGTNLRERMAMAAALRPFAVLRREDFPMLATFLDPAAPKTMQEVGPDDLASSFGPGHVLKRLTFQVVGQDEPLTAELAKRFPHVAPGLLRSSLRPPGGAPPPASAGNS